MKVFNTPLILVFSLFLSQVAVAQKEANHWYFGENDGIDFNSGSAVAVFDGAIFTGEGCSAISDADGNLLFYTDGLTIWNKNHQPMPNGINLAGDPIGSCTQSALIVPQPGNAGIYYVFTTVGDGLPNGFCYSIVDMSLNSGLGDVTNTKNVILFGNTTEKLTAVQHPGNGVWVLSHQWGNDAFYAYDLLSTGLNTTPVISHTGLIHSNSIIQYTHGQMKFSPDRKKVALAIGGNNSNTGHIQLFDFDETTGMVSHPIGLPIPTANNCYGVEFSPNGKLLYITQYDSPDDYYYLDQYDVSSGDSVTINTSRTNIITSFDLTNRYYGLQVAPDGKIYVAKAFSASLGVINFPDSIGESCHFIDNSFIVDTSGSGLHQCQLGLPGFVQSYFEPAPIANFKASDTVICVGSCIDYTDLSVNEPYLWHWYFNGTVVGSSFDKDPVTVCYDTIGKFATKLTVKNFRGSDSIVKLQYVTVLTGIGSGKLSAAKNPVCENTLARLTLTGNAGGLQWQSSNTPGNFMDIPGEDSTAYSFIASQTAYYRVTSSGNCPGNSDTLELVVIPAPVASYTSRVNGHTVTFNADSSVNAVTYLWDFDDGTTSTETDPVHTYDTSGTYHVCLTVKNNAQCNYTLCKNLTIFPTGIGNVNNESFYLYPNPIANELIISRISSAVLIKNIEMLDILGREIVLPDFSLKEGMIKLDVSGLSSGMYFVKIHSTAGILYVQSLIKE